MEVRTVEAHGSAEVSASDVGEARAKVRAMQGHRDGFRITDAWRTSWGPWCVNYAYTTATRKPPQDPDAWAAPAWVEPSAAKALPGAGVGE